MTCRGAYARASQTPDTDISVGEHPIIFLKFRV